MDILQYTFFQNALIGALLASILCGFVAEIPEVLLKGGVV